MAKSPDLKPTTAKGTHRRLPVPSCSLTVDDLRRLFRLLEKKADEAIDLQIQFLQRQPNQSAEEFRALKDNVRSLMKLIVRVQGNTGEWTAASSLDVLSDESIPDRIVSVIFDSSFLFRTTFNLPPQNAFTVNLDFSRTNILDMTNLALQADEGGSFIDIQGSNDAWVKSAVEELRSFFEQRKRIVRGWLHSRFSYDFLVLVLGFPVSFALVRCLVCLSGLGGTSGIPHLVQLHQMGAAEG